MRPITEREQSLLDKIKDYDCVSGIDVVIYPTDDAVLFFWQENL